MDQAMLVQVLQPQRGLPDVVARLGHRQGVLLLDQPRQVGPLDVFHGQKEIAVRRAGVVSVNDVRMPQLTQGVDFALEAAHDLRVGQQFLTDQLQGNDAVHVLVPGLEHLARAPFAQALQEQVGPHRQPGAASLKELIDLVRGHPATLDQLAGQDPRVRDVGESGQLRAAPGSWR